MAVKPVTPVDVAVCELYDPPLPPVYGIELLTPLAAVPPVKVPLVVVLAQPKEVIKPVRVTDLVNVQVCPPRLIAKLAVPEEFGVPVIV